MRVLVTGAAGFVGSNVVKSLKRCKVTAVDNMQDSLYPLQQKVNAIRGLATLANVDFIQLDLAHGALESLQTKDFDVIVHCAATPGLGYSWENPHEYVVNNVLATSELLRFIERHTPKSKLIHLSTSSVYGREATGSEMSSTRPSSPYGITKLAAEELVRSSNIFESGRAIILRLFSVYGPGQRADMAYHQIMISLLTDSTFVIRGNGMQTRTNTFIDDLTGFLSRLVSGESDWVGGVYNIGGDQLVSLLEAIDLIQKISGLSLRSESSNAIPGDQLKTQAESSLAREVLGFRAPTSLADGLSSQWEWIERMMIREKS